jgi:VanZ family protein
MRLLIVRTARVFAWVLLATAVVLSVVPPEMRPATGLPHGIEHFAMFFSIGIAMALGYPRRELILCGGLTAFTAALEISQLLVPGRHARLVDFVVDAAAALVGVMIIAVLGRRTRKTSGVV